MPNRLDPRVSLMTEAQLQDAIVAFAELNEWRVTFSPDWMKRLAFASMKQTRRSGRSWPKAGTPDLICVRSGRLVIAELKSHAGQVKADQWAWVEACAGVPGVEAYIWRPDDWIDGSIDEVLK